MIKPPAYTTHIKAISPRRSKAARLRQYNAAKSRLLPRYPADQHDAIIRALCKHLKI